jgi:hypothetical protein
MDARFLRSLALLGLPLSLLAGAQGSAQSAGDFADHPQAKQLPTETILVKGAWSSASDSVTPLPESGTVASNAYTNPYFGLTYPLSSDWTETYSGPPPSDSGYYVLAQIMPSDARKGATRASILITAEDLFFTSAAANNAQELINYSKDRLNADYEVEQSPTLVTIAGHSFVRFDYVSTRAELHWHVLATQIRCHTVQFVFATRDTRAVESLIQQMDKMILPAEAGPISGKGGGSVPVCIKDYASRENLMERVDPVFTERRFNAVPVRIIIDQEGKVKHIHFLSAFPDQARAIADALWQWRFRRYVRDGHPVEVETGILFGSAPHLATRSNERASPKP